MFLRNLLYPPLLSILTVDISFQIFLTFCLLIETLLELLSCP